jgi:predicted ribosomally synthesized peptide with nif11-like leader
LSNEQAQAFWNAIQADKSLQQKLNGVTDPDSVVAIAKEAGFEISAEDLGSSQNLSEDDLSDLSGGIIISTMQGR